MKWFDKWFARKWRWACENQDSADEVKLQTKLVRLQDTEAEAWEDGLRITIKKMIGGSVVSFRTYDKRTDRTDNRNYIITDEQDFTTELGKIITLESMRQT